MKTINPGDISNRELHGYLIGAVAPRPIAFASTIDREGNVNLSPFSFFNVFSTNPPIMIFSPARRGTNNTTKHTYDNLLEVPETVINIVNYEIVEQMSLASTEYPRGINEFEKAGFTQAPSVKIKPPRVGESPISFECTVDDIIELGDQGGAGNLVICRVVMIHIHERFLAEDGRLDTTRLDLVGRMGGNWYCRAGAGALFEIPRPLRTHGIGVDRLPASIRNSDVLTGNDLGRLGNVDVLPSADDVDEARNAPEVAAILKLHAGDPEAMLKSLHGYAQSLLSEGDTEGALRTLLVLDREIS